MYGVIKSIAKGGIFTALALLAPSVLAASGISTNGGQIIKFELPSATCQLAGMQNLRQCVQKYDIVVNALDLGHRCSHNNARPSIAPLQSNRLAVIMPDESKRVAAWRTYGVCSGMDDSRYFRELSGLSDKVNFPSIMNAPRNVEVQKSNFSSQLMRENNRLQANQFDLVCATNARNQQMLTHIDVCMQNGRFTTCPVRVNNCGEKFYLMSH